MKSVYVSFASIHTHPVPAIPLSSVPHNSFDLIDCPVGTSKPASLKFLPLPHPQTCDYKKKALSTYRLEMEDGVALQHLRELLGLLRGRCIP